MDRGKGSRRQLRPGLSHLYHAGYFVYSRASGHQGDDVTSYILIGSRESCCVPSHNFVGYTDLVQCN